MVSCTLFIRTFTEGMDNPKARATLSEWIKELRIYYKKSAIRELSKELSGHSNQTAKQNQLSAQLPKPMQTASKIGSLFNNIFK